MAIDCSALVQLSLQTSGISISRNSSQQKLYDGLYLIDLNNAQRGDLIFWDGHVGIFTNQTNMVHANAFHMKVSMEKTNEVIKRTKRDFQIYRIKS